MLWKLQEFEKSIARSKKFMVVFYAMRKMVILKWLNAVWNRLSI